MVSLQTCSDKASEIIQREKDAIARDAHTFPPGLKEQYDLQMKLLEDPTVPDFEILFMPFMFLIPIADPDKPHITLASLLSRPFSRGTIVSEAACWCRLTVFMLRYFLAHQLFGP